MSASAIEEKIVSKIFYLRGEKVILDRDIAKLYGVETRVLNQAVTRNQERFPKDFMFNLTRKEFSGLMSQIVISKGGTRKLPFAFTEHGVAMLSSVLNSKKAIQVNIEIIRTFTKLRKLLSTHEELRKKIENLERKYDYNFEKVFELIDKMIFEDEKISERKIGFKVD